MPRLPPVPASPVQPALYDPQTGAVTLQHPTSFHAAQQLASAVSAEDGLQPPQTSYDNSEAPGASNSAQAGHVDGTSVNRAITGYGGIEPEVVQSQHAVPGSLQQPTAAEAYRIACLWTDERFVARRLLALVALAKELMSLPAPSWLGDAQARSVPTACRRNSTVSAVGAELTPNHRW